MPIVPPRLGRAVGRVVGCARVSVRALNDAAARNRSQVGLSQIALSQIAA